MLRSSSTYIFSVLTISSTTHLDTEHLHHIGSSHGSQSSSLSAITPIIAYSFLASIFDLLTYLLYFNEKCRHEYRFPVCTIITNTVILDT